MSDIILLPRLIRSMNAAFNKWNLQWNFQILQGQRELFTLQKKKDYFTQRLSSSTLGGKCIRKIFYAYHQVAKKPMDGRLLRLFNSGFMIENMLIANLQACDIEASGYNKENNNRQWEYTAMKNRLVSKLDGIIFNGIDEYKSDCNLEIKGVNNKSFNKFKELGLKEYHDAYYGQVQVGMALSGRSRCVFLVMNKDNSKLYAELVPYDEDRVKKLVKRSKKLLANPTLLPPTADDYCYNCDFNNVCKNHGEVLKRCRTCNKYKWDDNTCKIDNHDCEYCDACDKWELLEMTGEW